MEDTASPSIVLEKLQFNCTSISSILYSHYCATNAYLTVGGKSKARRNKKSNSPNQSTTKSDTQQCKKRNKGENIRATAKLASIGLKPLWNSTVSLSYHKKRRPFYSVLPFVPQVYPQGIRTRTNWTLYVQEHINSRWRLTIFLKTSVTFLIPSQEIKRCSLTQSGFFFFTKNILNVKLILSF